MSGKSSKRPLSPDVEQSEVKRQKADEKVTDRSPEDDVEERMAEEKLRQLQELAARSENDTGNSATSQSVSSASSSSAGCAKSSWQQISNLLVYTAAGVRGSDKVRTGKYKTRSRKVKLTFSIGLASLTLRKYNPVFSRFRSLDLT